ncbi:MAG: Ring,2-phenylacetyl-CoA epoxidase subunit PaaE [Sediminibacterium sp.]|nr:Ring,2-phenylacetyl-CoA epoxidase subunit PaaE [Sediminibacterium sp.]
MDDALKPNTYLLRVRKIIPETPDTRSFVLEEVNGKRLNYTAGQFLTFLFSKKNGEEDRRNYSISSIPISDDPLTITVKRIPNGEYSRRLVDTIQEGDELVSIGASGFFTLPGDMELYDRFIFFAAGSGITPVYSLIKTLLHYHPSKQVVLIYSNRSAEFTIFSRELKQLKESYPEQLHIEFLFSDAKRIAHKRLGIYVLEKLLEKYIDGPLNRQLFYLCGPFEYMRMITIVLKNNGVAASHIRKEIFSIEKPQKKAEPPDKELHTVSATLRGREYQFQTQYPETILQSAKALNISLPYSCEAGQCGTCAATCVSGKVFMWRNDVLLDEEIAKGRVLTCTGYAVGGDVELEY